MPSGDDTRDSAQHAPTLILDADDGERGEAMAVAEALQPPDALRRGRQVEHYVVLDEIGRGGMSTVYRAYDARLHREVALKVLRRATCDATASARMLREARAMAQLAHPHVVQVYDAGSSDGRDWVAMELVEGRHLGEWLSLRPRAPELVLDVMRGAGLGLAAAHQKGLVHRDFKPGNVLVGPDDRARVTDFGLARAVDSVVFETQADVDDASREAPETVTGALSNPLTRAGTVLGTPAYMSPEQHDARAVDARSDQYAYCLTLWEALYGARPFPSDPLAARAAKRAGELPPQAPRREIAAPVHAALLRGLAPQAGDRFATMAELLAALHRDPKRGPTTALIIGIVVAGLAVGAVAIRAAREDRQICGGGPARVQGVWNESRAQAIAAAFGAAHADTWTRARGLVDQYTERWVQAHHEACEATAVDGSQSAAVLDLRQACLDDRLGHVDALLAVFEGADEEVVRRAVQATSGLPGLPPCANVQYLQARVAPPADAHTADGVEALRDRQRQAFAQESAGRYELGAQMTDAALEEARELGYAPLVAELLRRRGSLAMQRGQYDAAEPLLREAFFTAAGVRDDEVAAEAAIDLSFATSVRARVDEGEQWLRHAEMLSISAHLPPRFEARRADRLGHIRTKQDRDAEARVEHQRALDIMLAEAEPNAGMIAQYRMHLAIALVGLGRFEEAEAQYEQTLANFVQERGADHPDVGIVLINLGSLYHKVDRLDDAVEALGRALEIFERKLGPDHTYVGSVSTNLAAVHTDKGEHERALSFAHRAVTVQRSAFGARHPVVADDLTNLAQTQRAAGLHADALATLRVALEIQLEHLPPDDLRPTQTRAAIAELSASL